MNTLTPWPFLLCHLHIKIWLRGQNIEIFTVSRWWIPLTVVDGFPLWMGTMSLYLFNNSHIICSWGETSDYVGMHRVRGKVHTEQSSYTSHWFSEPACVRTVEEPQDLKFTCQLSDVIIAGVFVWQCYSTTTGLAYVPQHLELFSERHVNCMVNMHTWIFAYLSHVLWSL